jgi:predicted HicB family RNase H-like nuclease
MMNMLRYKGYYGSVNVSFEDGCLYGKLEFIDPLVTFEAQTVPELLNAFHEAVDDYIATCEEQGVKPQKPYSGSFNVRIGPELHKAAARVARLQKTRLNEFVKQAIQRAVETFDASERNREIPLMCHRSLDTDEMLSAIFDLRSALQNTPDTPVQLLRGLAVLRSTTATITNEPEDKPIIVPDNLVGYARTVN